MHGRAGPGGSATMGSVLCCYGVRTLLSSVCACGCLTYVCTYSTICKLYV